MHRIYSGVLGILLAASPVVARIMPEQRVDQMSAGADVIIKGSVEKVDSLGEAKSGDYQEEKLAASLKTYSPVLSEAEVKVDRAIKGAVAGTVKVRFLSSSKGSFMTLKKGEYVLLFLKRRGGNLYLFDIDNGKLVAARKPNRSKDSANGPSDAITEEMREMASDSDGDRAVEGIRGLRSLKNTSSLPMLKTLSRDSRGKVRAAAIGARLGLGDSSAGDELIERLSTSNSTAPTSADDPQEYIGAIDSLARSEHPRRVKMIRDLTEHKNQFVKQQAVYELRRMKAPESVPTLAKLLDDPDFRIQYAGVITLCEIAHSGRKGCPSAVKYERDQERIRAEWKAWATAHPDGNP